MDKLLKVAAWGSGCLTEQFKLAGKQLEQLHKVINT